MKISRYVKLSKFTSVCMVPFMWGAYFCMGAYKRSVVVVIKIGILIFMACLFCVGAYYRMYSE